MSAPVIKRPTESPVNSMVARRDDEIKRDCASDGSITPMMLLTKQLRRQLPKLHGQESKGLDAIIYVKFFTPDAHWTWFATEFDGKDTFFGFVQGDFPELGYFSLSELQQIRGRLGLPVERDRYFTPKTLRQVMEKPYC